MFLTLSFIFCAIIVTFSAPGYVHSAPSHTDDDDGQKLISLIQPPAASYSFLPDDGDDDSQKLTHLTQAPAASYSLQFDDDSDPKMLSDDQLEAAPSTFHPYSPKDKVHPLHHLNREFWSEFAELNHKIDRNLAPIWQILTPAEKEEAHVQSEALRQAERERRHFLITTAHSEANRLKALGKKLPANVQKALKTDKELGQQLLQMKKKYGFEEPDVVKGGFLRHSTVNVGKMISKSAKKAESKKKSKSSSEKHSDVDVDKSDYEEADKETLYNEKDVDYKSVSDDELDDDKSDDDSFDL